jgi:phosphatidylglycerol:prolipoprotein diacylglycerol transferase
MHKIIFEIGPFTLYAYGLSVAVAFLMVTLLMFRDAPRFGVAKETVFDCMIAIMVGGILGGRALFVLINLEYYASHIPDVVMLQEGGLAIQGAIIGAVLAGIIAARIKKVSFWAMSDLIAPYIALGQAVGRIGCLLNGCCYGKVTSGGVGLIFPGEAVMRIPTQVYSSLGLLVIYLFLLKVREKRTFPGRAFSMYLILYSVLRFFMDFFRGDGLFAYAGITLSQWISIVMFIVGIILYGVLGREKRREK